MFKRALTGLFFCGIISVYGQDYFEMKTTEFLALKLLDEPIKKGDDAKRFMEAAVFHYTNLEREKKKRLPFRYDLSLFKAAEYHSEQMCARNFFSHTGKEPGLKRPDERITHFGGAFLLTGENIAEEFLFKEIAAQVIESSSEFYTENKNGEKSYPYTYRQVAEMLVKTWMNSPPHRENILDKKYIYMAVGVQVCPADGKKHKDYRILATQCFGTKPK